MFDLDGQVGSKYYANISSKEQEGKLEFDQDTIDWWDRQGDEAKKILERNQRPLAEVTDEFHNGFISAGAVYLWGNGANFDPVLWETACRVFGKEVPWKFWNVRCCRTWCAAHDFNAKSVPFTGIKHFALDDALHQVKYVLAACQRPEPIVNMTPEMAAEIEEQMKKPGGNTFGMI